MMKELPDMSYISFQISDANFILLLRYMEHSKGSACNKTIQQATEIVEVESKYISTCRPMSKIWCCDVVHNDIFLSNTKDEIHDN